MGNKKKIARFLREEGKKLPLEVYEAYHKYLQPQRVEHEGEIKLVFGEVEKHKVNHGRRLKKLYQTYGKAGVDKYFSDRGFKLIPKNEEENNEAPTES